MKVPIEPCNTDKIIVLTYGSVLDKILKDVFQIKGTESFEKNVPFVLFLQHTCI